jgi:Zn-finger nucleic acid-binding protein
MSAGPFRVAASSCPRCGIRLRALELVTGDQVRECPECDGLFVTAEELASICRGMVADTPTVRARIGDDPPLHCPICTQPMQLAYIEGVAVELCPPGQLLAVGHGVWLDFGELQRILKATYRGVPGPNALPARRHRDED